MDNKPSEFLFINKNSSSAVLSRSNHAKEKFDILSHVRKRKPDIGSSKSGAEPWAKYSLRISFDDGQSAKKSHSKEQGKASLNLRATSRQDPSTSLPQVYPNDNALDPFHCTVAGNDFQPHALLRFTFSRTANIAFLAEAFAPSVVAESRSRMRHDNMVKARLEQCVRDEMLMYSTLAYSSSLLAWAAGHLRQEKSPDFYMGKALPAVRAQILKLKHPENPWLLLSMYSLAITELWNSISEMWIEDPAQSSNMLENRNNSRQAARTHLSAMLCIVKHIGGFGKVDPYVMESMILAGKFLAINDMTMPLMPMSWDPGPLPEARRKDLTDCDVKQITQGLNLIRISICDELKQIVRDIVDYVQVAEHAWASPKINPADESWLFLRLQTFSHRLLHLRELSDLENCVRLTLLLFLLNTTQYRGAQISAQILLRRLHSAILETHRLKVPSGAGILFWCLCTGALTAYSSNIRKKFVDMVADSCNSLRELTERALQERLTPYLFLPERQGGPLSDLVKELSALGHEQGSEDPITSIAG
ncbi:hypothetical protein MMC10_005898 [Thelotrema lepadinum]|nr:hypothetical protein [Thelotrema lepadinum]